MTITFMKQLLFYITNCKEFSIFYNFISTKNVVKVIFFFENNIIHWIKKFKGWESKLYCLTLCMKKVHFFEKFYIHKILHNSFYHSIFPDMTYGWKCCYKNEVKYEVLYEISFYSMTIYKLVYVYSTEISEVLSFYD